MQKFPVGISSLRPICAGILAVFSSASIAGGFALIEQSASQMGNAFAGGAAFANDASTIYFNPAGMTRLPAQLVGGIHYVDPSAKFDGTATDIFGGAVSGGNGSDTGQDGVVPNLYITAPLGNGLFAGLGINVPFGLSTEYDEDWKGRYHAIESEVTTVNFNPSLAYKVNNQLSVGAGVSLQYMDAKLTNAIDQGSLCAPTYLSLEADGILPPGASAACAALTPQGADGFAKVEGDNWAGGYNVGILFEPSNSTRLGLSYRSKVKQTLRGNARFRDTIPQFAALGLFQNGNISASIDLPQSASLSAWHDVNSTWSVMADATWISWGNFDELRVEFDSVVQPDSVVDENWDDVMRYSVGVDYHMNSAWTFRGGVAYDETPIKDAEHRTPRIPGDDRTWVSVGFGYQINQSFGVDVGYAHLFVDDPKINHTATSAGNINGEYDADVNILSAQLVWNI